VAGIHSLPASSNARRTSSPSFPRKRESSASAWIPGLRFTSPGMTGERWLLLFSALPDFQAWLASCGFRPPPMGGESLFVYSNKKGRKNAAQVIPLFLRFSARPGVGRRVHSRGQHRPSLACPCGPDPAGPAMLGRDEGGTETARRLPPASPAMLGAAQRAVRPRTLHARRCQLRLEGSIGQGWPIEVRATGSGSHRPWKA